uniref:NADH-ubiquinone oxidoreductase chain 2 n=1 Tax=Callispa bowringii TaxID=2558238 RepID=A0A482JNB9_9CUCU|nr:NADH dehydrogenase subunit 2 [Callispa bowringii]QBP33857.1 NADH dehydrogenase subunit 2 [Callispa bowringii]
MFMLSNLLFLTCMMIGVLITISSHSWLTMWLGMEINLLSIMPLITNEKTITSGESALKYFITQAIASTIFLMSIFLMEISSLPDFYIPLNLSIFLSQSALLMKLGMAPFHAWFPEVAEGLKWNLCLVLFTIQKIAPFFVLMSFYQNVNLLSLSIVMSSIISGILGMGQTSLRKILAYSSINHMSWLLLCSLTSMNLWILYLVIYIISTLVMVLTLSYLNIYSINQLLTLKANKPMKILMTSSLLSIGGLPPFMGFLPKWMVVMMVMQSNLIFITVIVIISTLISLYIYLRLMFPIVSMKSQESSISSSLNLNLILSILGLTFLLSLPVMSLIFNL